MMHRLMPLSPGVAPSWSKKVKAHTSDEAIATKEQQNGNWQADRFADMGAQACQLPEAEIRPILKKDRVLWQLQSRM
eukprot:228395-Karenia_brevis.AAC.1